MTIIRALNPRNLLIVLCALALVMVGIKGVNISKKINAVAKAEALYTSKQLVEAEEWYQQATRNRSIHYKDALIAERLTELAPVTSLKEKLADIQRETDDTVQRFDFHSFMDVYAKQQEIRNTYIGNDHPYEAYYRQISETYRISEGIASGFAQFKQHFEEQMQANLDQQQYADESFKSNLLLIPDAYYDEEQKMKQLLDQFKRYDEKKLAYIGAAGQFDSLLSEALRTWEAYKPLDIEAPWIASKLDDIVLTILNKDAEREDIVTYAVHAESYIAFLEASSFESDTARVMKQQMETWMKQAKRLTAEGSFEEAIALYEALSGYQDTSADIQAVNLAWAIAEPARMLQGVNNGQTFQHIAGGGNRFQAAAYAVALDEHNRLYFATWDGSEEEIKILTGDQVPSHSTVQSLVIDDTLSTAKRPIVLITSSSDQRQSMYTLVQITEKKMNTQLQIEADALEIVEEGRLRITNPLVDGAEGRIANYRLLLGNYHLIGYEKTKLENEPAVGSTIGYTDIDVTQLTQHAHERVRFNCEVITGADGTLYGVMGDSYVKLSGDIEQPSGGILTVIGMFQAYTELELGNETHSIPVFEVELIED